MRNKLIYCIPLALSITCLIGCAAKAAQMPAEPEPVALLPEQKQSSIVTNDAKNETIPTLRIKFVIPRLTLYNPRFVTYITSNADFLHGSRGFFHTKVMPVAGRRKAQMPR